MRQLREHGGLSASQARKLLRRRADLLQPGPSFLDAHAAGRRAAALRARLPEAVVRSVLTAWPDVLRYDFEGGEALPEKFAALEEVIGLPLPDICRRAPSLLGHNHSTLLHRRAALAAALPSVDVGPLLRRAPALLGRSASALAAAHAALHAAVPDVPVAALVRTQPTLLALNVSRTVRPKYERLRELCTPEEWRSLCDGGAGSGLARALTCSLDVIERLGVVAPLAEGSTRPVIRLLVMSKNDFDEAYRQEILAQQRGVAVANGKRFAKVSRLFTTT